MILVTGAAGKTGQAIIRALKARGAQVRALVHDEKHSAVVEAAGADEVFSGDQQYFDACAGAWHHVEAVYHIAPNVHPYEVAMGQVAMLCCKEYNVRRLVYHSVLHPHVEIMPHHWDKMRVEELLFQSGLDFTILQPCAYMQNVLAYREAVFGQGVYAVPYGGKNARISMVDLEDVAQVAARVLTEDGHAHAIYELAGPDALDPDEVVAAMARAAGREAHAGRIALDDWQRAALAGGLSEVKAGRLAKMFYYYDQYGLTGNPRVLEWLLERPATRFDAFLAREWAVA